MSENKFLSASLVFVVLALGSCKKDFLEKYPITSIAPQTFFKTEKDLEVYCNGMYSIIPGAGLMVADEQSDNMETTPANRIVEGKYLVPAAGGGWTWSYLRNVNYFVENYSRADASIEAKNHYAGVARFFRAWFYAEKVKRFGDVPWYLGTLNINDSSLLYKARDSRVLVMDSVLSDLNFAIANLRMSGPRWTIHKYVALAMKSRICLYEGTWRKYRSLPDAGKFLQAARDASRELIDAAKYSLYNVGGIDQAYFNLFAANDAPPNEVILANEYRTDLNVKHAIGAQLRDGFGRGLTKEMVNTYLMKDGSPFTSQPGYATMTYTDEFVNRDPRLIQTVLNPIYTRTDRNDPTKRVSPVPRIGGGTPTGYQQIKFYQDDPIKEVYGNSDNDAVVIRYGEVLLNYAEAKAELGELTQSDLDISVNKLRARVGMPNMTMVAAIDPVLAAQYPSISGNAVLLEIRRERRVELACEGFRYDDLMRWKAGNLLANKFYGIYFPALGNYDLNRDGMIDFAIVTDIPNPRQNGVTYSVINKDIFLSNGNSGYITPYPTQVKVFDETKHYLFPLPTTELLLNNKLVQNPNW